MRCGSPSTGCDKKLPAFHPLCAPFCRYWVSFRAWLPCSGLLRTDCKSGGVLMRACACGDAQLCRQFEEAFAKSVDGGKGGGEQILTVFERRLTENIRQLEFRKILEPQNVKRIVEEADGYQPHLIAPEMGYRRLLQARACSLV